MGNTAVVHIYKHERYKYSVSGSGHINLVLVDKSKLIQPVIVVADLYWLKFNYGIQYTFTDIYDNVILEAEARLFTVRRFNLYQRRQEIGSPF